MGAHRHGPHAGAAAAVRNAERLVQVQVGHVRTELARLGHADHRVHVGAVQVDLAASLVDQIADLGHGFFEHAVRGRVGHHDRGQAVAVLLGVEADVFDIDVAVGVGLGHHHLHAAHLRRGRVGAMRRVRNQADIAMTFAPRAVVGADRQQAGVFALRAGVRLQADRVVTGALHQHRFQRVDQFLVAQRLVGRHQRMDLRELRPGHRNHLGGGVELHRARAQRDHRAIQGQILVGQAAQVAQHVGFGLHAGEDRVRQDGAFAGHRSGDAARGGGVQRVDVQFDIIALQAGGEHVDQRLQVGRGDGLVKRHRQAGAVAAAPVDVLALGGRQGGRGRGGQRLRSVAFAPDFPLVILVVACGNCLQIPSG
ncbi:hypothetical protein G6F57_015691 [Rhizopus arrhizus]|nr:hypothetical protein G6F57_015691 [Rhizopus arrhizus]